MKPAASQDMLRMNKNAHTLFNDWFLDINRSSHTITPLQDGQMVPNAAGCVRLQVTDYEMNEIF